MIGTETKPQHLTLAEYIKKPVFRKKEKIVPRNYQKAINILLPIFLVDKGIGLTVIEAAIKEYDNGLGLGFALERMVLDKETEHSFSNFDTKHVLEELHFIPTHLTAGKTPLQKLHDKGFSTLEDFNKLLNWYAHTLVQEISLVTFQLAEMSNQKL